MPAQSRYVRALLMSVDAYWGWGQLVGCSLLVLGLR